MAPSDKQLFFFGNPATPHSVGPVALPVGEHPFSGQLLRRGFAVLCETVPRSLGVCHPAAFAAKPNHLSCISRPSAIGLSDTSSVDWASLQTAAIGMIIQ